VSTANRKKKRKEGEDGGSDYYATVALSSTMRLAPLK